MSDTKVMLEGVDAIVEYALVLCEAASPEPWIAYKRPPMEKAKMLEDMAKFLQSESDVIYGVALSDDGTGERKSPCVTGNGPTSEANAVFIANARSFVPFLAKEWQEQHRRAEVFLDECKVRGREIERLRTRVAELEAAALCAVCADSQYGNRREPAVLCQKCYDDMMIEVRDHAVQTANLQRGIEAYKKHGHWHVEDAHGDDADLSGYGPCDVCAWEREQREESKRDGQAQADDGTL